MRRSLGRRPPRRSALDHVVTAGLCLLAVALLIIYATKAPAAIFTTDDPGDQVDETPGNGVCAKAGGGCTLQAAVNEVNARDAGDTIRHEVTTVDQSGVIITVDDITLDGTQAAGFVPCTGFDCSAANWVGKLDMDGSNGVAIEFATGTTGGLVKGIEVFGGNGVLDYGIQIENGTAQQNAVHGIHGGIMCKAGTCLIEDNAAWDIVDFGFTSQSNDATIHGNVGCLELDGETASTMRYGAYAEDTDGVVIDGNLFSGCSDAGIHTKVTSSNTVISNNTVGLTRSGATTLCAGFIAYHDDGSDTVFEDNTLCPVPPTPTPTPTPGPIGPQCCKYAEGVCIDPVLLAVSLSEETCQALTGPSEPLEGMTFVHYNALENCDPAGDTEGDCPEPMSEEPTPIGPRLVRTPLVLRPLALEPLQLVPFP